MKQTGFRCGLLLLAMAWLWACDSKPAPPGVSETLDSVCIDMDGDGFGSGCNTGEDCDDEDSSVHDECLACRKPDEGCPCEEDQDPVDCRLPYSVDSAGQVLCHTGTRYCRDGVWSGCEGVVTFTARPPLRNLGSRALVDPSAPPMVCDLCNPDCYRIEDRLEPFVPDAGVNIGVNVAPVPSGGVTVAREGASFPSDAGLPPRFPGLLDDAPCLSVDMGDCDGLPPPFDPDPTRAPAGATHKTLFLDLPPGTSATQELKAEVSLGAIDLYFYLDTTYSMADEIDALRSALRAGNYFAGGGSDVRCVDADRDGAPDEALKEQGIVGNIACLAGDARFGAGWFREIPFYGPFNATGDPVAPGDMEMFEHRLDLSGDVQALQQTLGNFMTRKNLNTPEAGMQGLWALATGGEIYAGWDRSGVPARTGCPAGTFGYPCFRDAALPVVIQMTDAPMEGGPNTSARSGTFPPTPANCLTEASGFPSTCHPLHYDDAVLNAMQSGTEGRYRRLTTSAETIADAEPVGVIDDVLVTYIGDTHNMKADLTYDQLGGSCPWGSAWNPADESMPDVVFRFRVNTAREYLISGRGTRFDAALMVLRTDASGNPVSQVACDDDSVRFGHVEELGLLPELRLYLPRGDYLVVLKGYELPHDRLPEMGQFQLTLGRESLQSAGRFDAKRWLGPKDDGVDGVRAALQQRGIRVITMQSGSDSFADEQAHLLASATEAVGSSGALHGGIAAEASSVGRETVRVVRELLEGTRMDMSLELLQAPHDPTPDFQLLVEAVPTPDNGCNGVADADGDPASTPDTHLDCAPGARPQFRVTFTNPDGAGAVPPNPTDPAGQGGYHMSLRMLGDGKRVLDQVPVYIVPQQVRPDAALAPFLDSGSYEQEIRATACGPNEGPIWGTLSWEASLPADTRLMFEACAADDAEALRDCTFHEAVTVTRAGACQSALDCGETGYCDPLGTCHRVLGPMCAEDMDCGSAGTCRDLGGTLACTSMRPSLDLKPAAQKDMQGRRLARVRARLWSNPERTQAPTLLRWTLDYRCVPRQ